MKIYKLIAILVLCALFAPVALRAQESEHAPMGPADDGRHSTGWEKALKLKAPPVAPKFPKLGKDVERVVLDNGLIVYVQEDHRLPLIDAIALVRAGRFYEAPEELGISGLMGELMRSGGTKSLPPDKLDERLDFIAAQLSSSMGDEEYRIGLNVPRKDFDDGLNILADMIRNPQFDESRLELAKRQTIYGLRSSNDTAAPIMRREFSRLLFTPAHPAGRTPTVERIQQISREDLIRYHDKYFHPNQMMLGLTGDFNKAEMIEKVKKLFGDWPKSEVNLPSLPKANAQPKPGIYYVEKPLSQSSIRIGEWGTNRDNPDRFAIDLMNDILGGSEFSSRLMKRVRNDEGLAYEVGSAFPTSQRDISFFIAVAETKTETTVKTIDSIVDVIHKMATTNISKNEFETAKEMFLFSYVFRYAEPARSLGALVRLEYEGLPADYLEKEFAGYQAVTTADIERVAKKYLNPEQFTIFIVGDYPKFAQQLTQDLSKYGQPRQIQPMEFSDGMPAPARR